MLIWAFRLVIFLLVSPDEVAIAKLMPQLTMRDRFLVRFLHSFNAR